MEASGEIYKVVFDIGMMHVVTEANRRHKPDVASQNKDQMFR